jgi:hypothetical protein
MTVVLERGFAATLVVFLKNCFADHVPGGAFKELCFAGAFAGEV